MGKAGRPPKLNDALQKEILDALRAGGFRSQAARFAGINEDTLSHWMTEGKRSPRGRYGKFRREVLRAEAHAEMEHVLNIRSAAKKDWKASRFWLAVKRPDLYVLPEIKITVDAEIGFILDALERALSPEEYERALIAISESRGGEELRGPGEKPALEAAAREVEGERTG